MPNHITNIINAPKEVLDSLLNNEGEVDFNNIIPMPKDQEDNWYAWSCENWGTKWNAYDTYRIDDDQITFNTAWSAPIPFFEALSEKFPEYLIEVTYADEDMGHNCGTLTLEQGEVIESYIPKGGSKEAYELTFLVIGGENYYEWNEETNEYDYIG
jgi:hypothetical protein